MSRFAMSLVRQNIAIVAVSNTGALALATLGMLSPITATVFNNGSTLLAGANALRPLRMGVRGARER
jgi:Cu2+-exporting ATPase